MIKDIMKKKISRAKFLGILGASAIAIPLLSKEVMAKTFLRKLDGSVIPFDDIGVGGGGDVSRFGATTNNAITRWNGTGASIQTSGATISDLGILKTDGAEFTNNPSVSAEKGSVAIGDIENYTPYDPPGGNSSTYIYSTEYGTVAQGYIYAYNYGAYPDYEYIYSYIQAVGNGSHAGGQIDVSIEAGDGDYTYGNGYITAYGSGSFIHGMASVLQNGDGSAQARLTTSNVARGAWVGGYARSTGTTTTISCSANGSMAFGNAVNASILATAAGAIQFNPGTNNRANSLRIGGGLWFMGSIGTPSTPSNGMMWVANNNVYVRTGGVTKNMNAI